MSYKYLVNYNSSNTNKPLYIYLKEIIELLIKIIIYNIEITIRIFSSINNVLSFIINSLFVIWLLLGITSPIIFILVTYLNFGFLGNLVSGVFVFKIIASYITGNKKSISFLNHISYLQDNFSYYKSNLFLIEGISNLEDNNHAIEEFFKSKCLSKNNLFTCAPHGILATNYSLNVVFNKFFYDRKYLDCYFVISDILIKLPFVSEFLTAIGCISSKSETINSHLKNGDNIAILSGGYEEASITEYGKHMIYLKNLGIIDSILKMEPEDNKKKYYECYCIFFLNESVNYFTMNYFKDLRLKLAKSRFIPGVLFCGYCGIFPNYFKKLDNISIISKDAIKIPYMGNLYKQKSKDEKSMITMYFGSLIENKYHQLFKFAKDLLIDNVNMNNYTNEILFPNRMDTTMTIINSSNNKYNFDNYSFDYHKCELYQINN